MYNRIDTSFLFFTVNKNHDILTALHYKPLYSINLSEKWDKKNTNRGYIMARIVVSYIRKGFSLLFIDFDMTMHDFY